MHGALLDAGVAVDVLPAASPLEGYDVVLVPTLYLAPEDLSDRLTAVVARGGQVLVSYFSGIVDAPTGSCSAVTPGRSGTCSGCASRSSRRCASDGTVPLSDGEHRARSGPNG